MHVSEQRNATKSMAVPHALPSPARGHIPHAHVSTLDACEPRRSRNSMVVSQDLGDIAPQSTVRGDASCLRRNRPVWPLEVVEVRTNNWSPALAPAAVLPQSHHGMCVGSPPTVGRPHRLMYYAMRFSSN
jgi:hypothetical protein